MLSGPHEVGKKTGFVAKSSSFDGGSGVDKKRFGPVGHLGRTEGGMDARPRGGHPRKELRTSVLTARLATTPTYRGEEKNPFNACERRRKSRKILAGNRAIPTRFDE